MRALVRLLKQTLPEAISIAIFTTTAAPASPIVALHLRKGSRISTPHSALPAGIRPASLMAKASPAMSCTEDLVAPFGAMGVATVLDLNKRRAAGLAAESMPGQTPQSKALRVGQAAGA